jgi:hypothetical protein
MIGFISSLVTTSLNHIYYRQYSTIADLHTLEFTVAHALGFSVSTSLLATDLNTETTLVSLQITTKSSRYFVFNHAVHNCPDLYSIFTIH